MTNLTAIVLAGGRSSRMGRDKALINVKGVPMLQLICEVAGGCADTVYVVTSWPERYQHLELKAQFIREVPLLESNGNQIPQGPLVGFAQGLGQVKTDWVLLLACDLPNLRLDVLVEWVNQLETVPHEAIAALVNRDRIWEPLCGFYRQCCLPLLTEFVDIGGRSFQKWLKLHPVQALPLLDSKMILNCNTPQELSRITK